MKTEHAIELAGNAAGLADLLEITQSAVSQWGEFVPEARIWQLKVIRPQWFDEQPKTFTPANGEVVTDQRKAGQGA